MAGERPVHLEVEVLYQTTYTTACGATPTTKNATPNDAHVTCRPCLKAMGYEETDDAD